MTQVAPIPVSILSPEEITAYVDQLGELLHRCVHGGASVSFVLPFTEADSQAFWIQSVLPEVRRGVRILWVAWQAGRIAGSVQLDLDTPPNQPHRAEVRKLLVHPEFRRRGIARTLMLELERAADHQGRTLLTLDTLTGSPAQPLYTSLGYIAVGQIPGYSRAPLQDRLDPTTIMYKHV